MRWVWAAAVVVALAWTVRRFLEARSVASATPALRIAGGPHDAARAEAADEAAAGRPLLDAIVEALKARGADVDEVQAEDWGYAVDAIVSGQPLRLKLGAHGANGVGPEWLLVLDGAADSAGLRRLIEEAVTAVAGVKVLGWDD